MISVLLICNLSQHARVWPLFQAPAGHGAINLLVQQPRRGVARAQIALERQRRDPRLAWADEMYGLKSGCQRQLGMLHHRGGCHRSLVPAADALKQLAGALADEVVSHVVAAQAAKPFGPTLPVQSFGAVRFSADVPQKFGERHAGLELKSGELRLCGQYLMR